MPTKYVRIEVDPNPPPENVTAYRFYVDNVAVGESPSPSVTTDVEEGSHLFGVSAINVWGESGRAEFADLIAPPGTPANIRVTPA